MKEKKKSVWTLGRETSLLTLTFFAAQRGYVTRGLANESGFVWRLSQWAQSGKFESVGGHGAAGELLQRAGSQPSRRRLSVGSGERR